MTRPKKLRRVCDSDPGIRRERRHDGFVYRDADGQCVTAPEILERIRALAIPPAYSDVWICSDPGGHIQATGRDARGRKQYRYHPEWRSLRDQTKFGRMAAFGRALPDIRARVAHDIRLPGLPRAKVLATVLRLLEATLIRVGNDEYARKNASYGLTTLQDRHVTIHGSTLVFSFRGKHGLHHRLSLRDRTLAGIVKRSRDLPGRELFQYVDRRGRVRDVNSDDVNRYLQDCSGDCFTAKDFRTWAGSVLALSHFLEIGPPPSPARARRCVREVAVRVAARLGNTPAICRKSYIHPALIDAYLDGRLLDVRWPATGVDGLDRDETRLLAFLEEGCL